MNARARPGGRGSDEFRRLEEGVLKFHECIAVIAFSNLECCSPFVSCYNACVPTSIVPYCEKPMLTRFDRYVEFNEYKSFSRPYFAMLLLFSFAETIVSNKKHRISTK